MIRRAIIAGVLLTIALPATADGRKADDAASKQDALAGTERLDGMLPVHVDRKAGRIPLSLRPPVPTA